jgi:hypothetical protein
LVTIFVPMLAAIRDPAFRAIKPGSDVIETEHLVELFDRAH